jgi:hypothetical protein
MNEEGMNEEGMNEEGMNEEGMNEEGMNEEGMNKKGMNEEEINLIYKNEPYIFLYILSKKEILNIIKKNKKNINNNIKKYMIIKESLVKENYSFKKITNKTAKKIYYLSLKWSANNMIFKEYLEKKKNFNIYVVENREYYSKISKIFLYYQLHLLKSYLDCVKNTKIYFMFFMDFRGRLYYKSSIGVTEFKLSRYFLTYGEYDNLLVLNKRNIISDIIDEYTEKINIIKKKYDIHHNFQLITEAIFWCVIAIGKIFINKNIVKTHRNDIFDKGYELILHYQPTNILMDQIEYNYYLFILSQLSSNTFTKWIILKDATASFLQNLIRIMGPKNNDSLIFTNLKNSDYWYDPYSYILEKWKDSEYQRLSSLYNNFITKESISSLNKTLSIFERFTIKRPTLTKPYSATYLTSFTYFKNSVKQKFNIDIDFGSEEEKAFKRFYKFLEEMETLFFLNKSSKEMIEYIKQIDMKNITIDSHDSEINLTYFKLKTKNYDFIISIPSKGIKKRETFQYFILDEIKIDKNKIIIAVRANWVQHTDSILLRDIQKSMNISFLTIHDCVLIDVFNVSNFIISANIQSNTIIFEDMPWRDNIKNDDTTNFSIFIFI